VASCEFGDEHPGSGTTELVNGSSSVALFPAYAVSCGK
jgi:hypothetical protein